MQGVVKAAIEELNGNEITILCSYYLYQWKLKQENHLIIEEKNVPIVEGNRRWAKKWKVNVKCSKICNICQSRYMFVLTKSLEMQYSLVLFSSFKWLYFVAIWQCRHRMCLEHACRYFSSSFCCLLLIGCMQKKETKLQC